VGAVACSLLVTCLQASTPELGFTYKEFYITDEQPIARLNLTFTSALSEPQVLVSQVHLIAGV